MKVFRFMSKEEFSKYLAGEELVNETNHHKEYNGRTSSIGFCFFNEKDITPEEAIHHLTGIASMNVCVMFETSEDKLNKSSGVYSKKIESTGDEITDLFNLFKYFSDNQTITEYCTTKYNNKDFKLVKYAENLWKQWEPQNQKKFKWEKC